MTVRSQLHGALASRSFTFQEGLDAGATLSRLRANDLYCPSREIRVPRHAQHSILERVRPYTALGTDICASHVTAAQLHGMPLPWFADDIISLHLTKQSGGVAPRRRSITGHTMQLSRDEVMTMRSVPVTTPVRTFLDLAPMLNRDDLVAIADFLICTHDRHFDPPQRAVVPAAQLHSYIAGKFHVPGLRKAREALELMRVGADSPPETRLRLLLLRAGLPEFVPNHRIVGGPGEYEVYPDLACEEFKVCGEYEGEIHQTPKKQLFDRNRDERTAARGWQQVKVFSADVRRGEEHVTAMFAKALTQRGWRPG